MRSMMEMGILVFMGFVFAVAALYSVSHDRGDVEYEIELINQDSVRIYSVDGDRTYYTTPDSIQYYIEIDNL